MAMIKCTPSFGRRILAVFSIAVIGSSAASAQSPPVPPALTIDGQAEVSGLAPQLSAEYVDPSGVRRAASTSEGSVLIRGIAPFLVSFDASSSRAVDAFLAQREIADEEAYAFLMVGYRLNYGDQVGGVWPYPQGTNYSRDEDTGPPIFSRVYRSAGTYTARLRIRDELGNEDQVQMTVVVEAPASTIHIPVSAGQWPNFVSGTRYTLEAGGDYRSFGPLSTSGRHNISIEKTGSGSDPRIATFSPEARSKWDATSEFEYRAAHIRLVNVDVDLVGEGQRGFDYVGVIGGRMRRFSYGVQMDACHEGSRVHRTNVRHSRGFFLQDTEANNISDSAGYVLFGVFRAFHARNTRFIGIENGTTTWAMLRMYGTHSSYRNNLWFLAIDGGSSNGIPLSLLALDGTTVSPWRDDDTVGPLDSADRLTRYAYVRDKSPVHHNQFYAEGSYLTNGVNSTGGGPNLVRPRLSGWEDNMWYPSGNVAQGIQTGELRGNYMFWRNNRRNMGSGDHVGAVASPPNGDGITFHGPYFIESENTRPLPSTFQ